MDGGNSERLWLAEFQPGEQFSKRRGDPKRDRERIDGRTQSRHL